MDNRRKGALVASVIVVAAIIIALSLRSPPPSVPAGPGGNASDGNSTGGSGGRPLVPRQPVTLLAPPSSFPFVEKWVSQYNNEARPGTVHVDYTDEVDYIGSGAYSNSSDFLAHHLADIAITGMPTPPGFASSLVPVSPQAIAIVYNIPGFPDVPSGLKLDRPTLERLLSGNITRWDDSAIKDLNPGLTLPDKAVVVVHEGRARSATSLLEQYLSNGTAWPEKSVSAESADSLSTIVRRTPYSLGYLEFTYAAQTRMTFAAVQNADGQYVAPSRESIGAAVRNGTAVQNSTAMMSTSQLGNGSYPVVGLYYAALGGAVKPAALDFAKWIATEGQQVLKDMQYPSIYESSETLASYAASLRAEGAQPSFNSTNITQSDSESVYAQVAAEGANVYVAWEESMDDPQSNDDIFFKRSADAGNTFANAINMSNNLGFSEHP